jgi:hypothetical protein
MPVEPTIGLWTEIKLHFMREYAAAFTTILKEQPWCKGYTYIDELLVQINSFQKMIGTA